MCLPLLTTVLPAHALALESKLRDPFSDICVNTVPAMVNANLDLVGAVNRSVFGSPYAEKDSSILKYDQVKYYYVRNRSYRFISI